MTRLSFVFALGAAVAVAGCTVGPDFTAQKSDVAAYDLVAAPPPAVPGSPETAQRVVLGEKVEAEWWRLLHSRQLDEVLHQAIVGNRDLAAARASLTEAEEALNQ